MGERKDERGGTQQNYGCYTLSMPVRCLFQVFPGTMCCAQLRILFAGGVTEERLQGYITTKCFGFNISLVCQVESQSPTFCFFTLPVISLYFKKSLDNIVYL